MPFEATISAFAAALGEPSASPPATTRGRSATPDARRFSVYRNNVAVGLIGALEARYPVVAPDRRRGRCSARWRAPSSMRSKPRSPVMIAYGDDFPGVPRRDATGVGALPRRRGAARERLGRGLSRRGRAGRDGRRSCRARARSPARNADRLSPRGAAPALPDARRLALGRRAERARPGRAAEGAARTLSSPAPTATSQCARFPRLATISRSDCSDGATLIEAAQALDDPAFDPGAHLVGLVEAGAVAAIIPGQAS